MLRKRCVLSVLVLFAFVATSCGGAKQNDGSSKTSPDSQKVRAESHDGSYSTRRQAAATCECPDGYSINADGDGCVKRETTDGTEYDKTWNVCGGANDYGDPSNGAVYIGKSAKELDSGQIYRDGDQGVEVVASDFKDKLDDVGIWTCDGSRPYDEWIGFSKCIEIEESGDYLVGIAADNSIRFLINGDLVFSRDYNQLISNGNEFHPFRYWHVIRVHLEAGPNIIQMEGYNAGSIAAFGAEISGPFPSGTLETAFDMTQANYEENIVFSTKNLIGQELRKFDTGEDSGYSCPTDYVFDSCKEEKQCVDIDHRACESPFPDVVRDSYATGKNTKLDLGPGFGVLANDDDAGTGTLSVTKVEGSSTKVGSSATTSNGDVTVQSDGSLEYTPDTDFTGTDSFTYTADNGNGADEATVEVDVGTEGNSEPQVSDIDDQTVDANTTTGPISFTVRDGDDDESTLTLNGESTNTDLVPNSNISFGGSGTDRTVEVEPAPYSAGTTTIRITVDDGTDTGYTSFGLKVEATGPTNRKDTISFGSSFSNVPLIFTQVKSQLSIGNGTSAQIIDKSKAEFTVEFCEQEQADGCDLHGGERISWWAVDPEAASKVNGIEWGTVETSDGNWVTLPDAVTGSHGVLATVQTQNDSEKAVYAEVNSGYRGAKVRFCESDGGDVCDTHGTEKVAWIASESGALQLDASSGIVDAGETGVFRSLNDQNWYTESYSAYAFGQRPHVFATTQTKSGLQDPSIAAIRNVTSQSFEIQHCEWDGGDVCDGHATEDNAWAALSPKVMENVVGMEAGTYYSGVYQTISPVEGLVTGENGKTASFSIVLRSKPNSSVTIPVKSSDTSEVTASTDKLTFTTSNWDEPQTVTVTGKSDEFLDGNAEVAVDVGPMSSSDAKFDRDSAVPVYVGNLDDYPADPAVDITPDSALTVSEAGRSDSVEVVLSGPPEEPVTVSLEPSNTSEATTSPEEVEFTSSNWDEKRTVTVTGVDDTVNDGDQSFSIRVGVEGAEAFSNLDPSDISVTNIDDDESPFDFINTGQNLGSDTTRGIELADIDDDGVAELVTVNDRAKNHVYSNSGKGTFQKTQSFGGDSNPSYDLAVGELTGDDLLDVFVANRNEKNTVWFNGSNGLEKSDQALLGEEARPRKSTGVGFGRFDSGDTLDVYVANERGQNVRWLNPSGDGIFANKQEMGNRYRRSLTAIVADFTGDDFTDVITGRKYANPRLFENLGDGTGKLTGTRVGNDSSDQRDFAAADFNEDGNLDLYVARGDNSYYGGYSDRANWILINNGGGQFSRKHNPADDSNPSYATEAGDLDGDGVVDLIAGNIGANRIYAGDGNGGFILDSATNMGSSNTFGVTLGDIDGDGDFDAAFGNDGPNRVWKNNDPPDTELEAPAVALVGDSLSLNASSTSGDDPFSALSFSWTITNDPSNGADQLQGQNSSVARLEPSVVGQYEFQVAAEDRAGAIGKASATVQTHTAPTARLARDTIEMNLEASETLDASASSDEQDSSIGFQWEIEPPGQLGTASYTLTDADTATPTFVPHEAGIFEAAVTVSDSHDATGTADLEIHVNYTPSAKLVADTDLINIGETASYDASDSDDPDGSAGELQYSWELTKKPSQSTASISGQGGSSLDFTPDVVGEYIVQVTATDSNGATSTSTAALTVNGKPNAGLEMTAPNSDLQTEGVVELGDLVNFDASSSTDDLSPNELSYDWTLEAPSGSQAGLRSTTGRYNSFRSETAGDYSVTVEVTDAHGLTNSATAKVSYNTVPEAVIKDIKPVIKVGSAVPLKGQQSSDAEDGQNLKYLWTIEKQPPESSVEPAQPSNQTTKVTPGHSGVYEVALTVEDTTGSTDKATARFKAHESPKAAIARDEITVNSGETFQIDASGSKDKETHQLIYEWTYLQTPSGVQASNLPTPDGQVPALKLEKAGKYVLELTVIDDNGAEATSQVTILVNGAPEFVDPTPGKALEAVPGEKIVFEVATQDPDGDDVTVELEKAPEGAALEQSEVTWDPTYEQASSADNEFLLTATDGNTEVEHAVAIEFVTGGALANAEGGLDCDSTDCGSGEMCHLGQCYESCEGEQACSNPDDICLQNGRCATDPCERIVCEEGQTCYGGSCFATCEDNCDDPDKQCIEGRCTASACADVTCPEGQQCYQGSCYKPCESADDCSEDEAECIDNRCTTDPCAGVQCPTDQKCHQGSCFGKCEGDGDCSGDKQCVDNVCKSACKDVDCPEGEVCYQGSCMSEDEAEDRTDEAKTCEETSDCEGDKECVDGTCKSRSSGGCGCDVNGAGSSSGDQPLAIGLLMLLGIGALLRRRR